MIRKTLLVLITLASIVSCDNDLDIIAEWKDIPVVYGILNAQDSVHYVKLNKTFLGQGDVMSMAQEFDSLHYNQEEVGLRLIEYRRSGGQYIESKSIEMEPIFNSDKPDGIFSAPDQIIYKSDALLNNERYYSAEVYDKSEDTVIASTPSSLNHSPIVQPV